MEWSRRGSCLSHSPPVPRDSISGWRQEVTRSVTRQPSSLSATAHSGGTSSQTSRDCPRRKNRDHIMWSFSTEVAWIHLSSSWSVGRSGMSWRISLNSATRSLLSLRSPFMSAAPAFWLSAFLSTFLKNLRCSFNNFYLRLFSTEVLFRMFRNCSTKTKITHQWSKNKK